MNADHHDRDQQSGPDRCGIELGMSEPGELTIIAQIRPDQYMAVITNIGITHIEQLGSQENIYKEKMTIQDGLKEGGILFLNGDDPMLEGLPCKIQARGRPSIMEPVRILVSCRRDPYEKWVCVLSCRL